jgi:hypothetical protein
MADLAQPIRSVRLETESDSEFRDNLKSLNDSLGIQARPPHPTYMMAHDGLRVTQSSKYKTLYFLSQQCLEADLAGLLMLDQPRTLLPRRGPS